ncbi:MAG: glycosyltransferase [Bacteroidia bacterium]|nr:glycosyltransferase [Bacteroidia bacterium]MDW8334547.1 glycosyltransferase [Bacteroidia bacterium]
MFGVRVACRAAVGRKKEMNVALLSQPSNFHCRKWAKGLRQAGARVCVYSFEDGDAGPGVETVRIAPPWAWKDRYFYPSYEFTGERLLRELRARRTHVLHPMHATPFGVWALRTRFRPVVVAAVGADVFDHGPNPPPVQWQQSSSPLSRFKRRILRPFYRSRVRAVLRRADRITADNRALINAIVEGFGVGEEKIELLRWGVDPDMFVPTPEAEAFVEKLLRPLSTPIVLIPRGLKPVYRAETILACVERRLARGSDSSGGFVFLSAGYASDPRLLAQARTLHRLYPDKVALVETQLDEKTMGALWRRVEAFVSAPVYDGYSAAVAEGRYAGAVPIVDDSDAVREWYDGDNAIVVRPFDEPNLYDALELFFARAQDFRARFAERNRRWIERHSLLPEAARRFLQICQNLVETVANDGATRL